MFLYVVPLLSNGLLRFGVGPEPLWPLVEVAGIVQPKDLLHSAHHSTRRQ